MTKATGTQLVTVLTRAYMYHGRTYVQGDVIDMDSHDMTRALENKQIRLGGTVKPLVKKGKGPEKTMATGPSENR